MVAVVVLPALLLLTAVLTELAARGILRENRLVGIRIGSTLRSPEAWVAGHRAAAPWTWAGVAVSAVASVGALLSSGGAGVAFRAIVVAAFVATIVMALATASRAARAEPASGTGASLRK